LKRFSQEELHEFPEKCYTSVILCYKSVAKRVMLPQEEFHESPEKCFERVTRVLQACCKSVARVLQERNESVARALRTHEIVIIATRCC
jgi:uncharacterized protein Yka (UPF0111/DUF47 family)